MSAIHETIKAIRTEKGLKQEEVASKLSMAQSNYARLEKGLTQVTVDRLEQLADVFEMSVAAMLSYDLGQQQPTKDDIDYYIGLCKKYEKQITSLKNTITNIEENSNKYLVDKYDAIDAAKDKGKELTEKYRQKERELLEKLNQKEQELIEKLSQKDLIIAEKDRSISYLEIALKALSRDIGTSSNSPQ